MSDPRSADPQRNAATLLAMLALLAVAVGLLGITAMVIPSLAVIPLIVCGFLFFGVFHYLAWGRWLSNKRIEDDDEDQQYQSRQ